MKLGDYTFTWTPEKWELPDEVRYSSYVKTYQGGAFFSWGTDIKGVEITLEWEFMPVAQYERLQELLRADAEVVWDPEMPDRLFVGTVTNGPFVVGGVVTDSTTGATGTISKVSSRDGLAYIEVTGRVGEFGRGNTITDDSDQQKSATIQTVDIVKRYNVEIQEVTGKVFEVVGTNQFYRRDVKVTLVIVSEADDELGS